MTLKQLSETHNDKFPKKNLFSQIVLTPRAYRWGRIAPLNKVLYNSRTILRYWVETLALAIKFTEEQFQVKTTPLFSFYTSRKSTAELKVKKKIKNENTKSVKHIRLKSSQNFIFFSDHKYFQFQPSWRIFNLNRCTYLSIKLNHF